MHSLRRHSPSFVLIILFCATWLVSVHGQSSVQPEVAGSTARRFRIEPDKTQHLIVPDSGSDPAAIAVLKRFVLLTGGSADWSRIPAVQAKYHFSNGDPAGIDVLTLDSWSDEKNHYRRGVVRSDRTPLDHEANVPRYVYLGKQRKSVPEFDLARILVDHLPSAAAEIIVRRKHYVVKLEFPPHDTKDITLEVYRRQASEETAPFLKEQEWTLSVATGLLESVKNPITRYPTEYHFSLGAD